MNMPGRAAGAAIYSTAPRDEKPVEATLRGCLITAKYKELGR